MKAWPHGLVVAAALTFAVAAPASVGITSATPSALSIGTSIEVNGGGFSGGSAAKPRPALAWLTVGASPEKHPLKVAKSTATDAQIHASVVRVPFDSVGDACTLHVLPAVKGASELTFRGAGAGALIIAGPSIAAIAPTSGPADTLVAITGTHFGTKRGRVLFGPASCRVMHWTDVAITVKAPRQPRDVASGTRVGVMVVNRAGRFEDAGAFTTR